MKSTKMRQESRAEAPLARLSREFLDALLQLSLAEWLLSPASWT